MFFSVKHSISIGGKVYMPCVCYDLTKVLELTVKDFRVHFGITAQKATPILNKLVEERKLSKRVDKRISYFALVK